MFISFVGVAPHGARVSRLQYGTQVSRLRNVVSITPNWVRGHLACTAFIDICQTSSLATRHFLQDLTLQKYKETRCDILNN